MMGEKWEKVLSRAIGVNPIEINSALVSAQNRRRLYWTNIGMKPAGLFGDLESVIVQPKDQCILLKDILVSNADKKYFLSKKALTYVTNEERLKKKFTAINGEKGICLTHKGNINNTGTFVSESIKNNKSTTIDSNYYKGFGVRNGKCRQVVEDKYGITEERYNFYVRKKNLGFLTKIVKDQNDKSECLVSTMYKHMQGFCVYKNNMLQYKHEWQRIRRLTPTECERLQTVKDGYTEGVSDTQRYRMLGNGWTVEVIKHIFSYLE
jgi:DNA (cytosine-5)-methyltransferase 3A